MRHYVGSIPMLGVSKVQVLMFKFAETEMYGCEVKYGWWCT